MPTLPPRPPLRARPRLPRRLPYWVVAVAVSLATAALVGRLVDDAARARASWGATRTVLVATGDIAAGEPVSAGHVARRELPLVAVPPGAVAALPPGAVAVDGLHRGEVLLRGRLVRGGASPAAARLPAGTRGVAVPAADGLPVAVGDLVDVLATFDGADGGEPTFAVARAALVVHVGDRTATVAVGAEEAPRVAYALAAGVVTLTLSAGSSR